MRALQVNAFEGPGALSIIDLPRREPSAGEVEVRVAGVGVGYFDALLARGRYQIKPPLPFVPGSSFAGVVTAVGDGVTQLSPGDHVTVFTLLGGMAEYATVDAGACVKIPAEVPLVDAANLFVAWATGLFGLRECGRLRPGETVLVLGAAGTTGLTATAVAKALGARVIACASTEAKRARCREAGADVTVDGSDPDWKSAVRAAAGRGVNVVYDPVGGELSEVALRLLAPGGRHLVVGFVAGIPRVPLNLTLLKRCSVVGVNWGGEVMENPSVAPPVVEALVRWSRDGVIRTAPDHVVPLARAGEVFDALFGRSIHGTIVVTP